MIDDTEPEVFSIYIDISSSEDLPFVLRNENGSKEELSSYCATVNDLLADIIDDAEKERDFAGLIRLRQCMRFHARLADEALARAAKTFPEGSS